MTSALEGCAAYSTANARIDSAGNEVVRAPPRRVLDVGCGSGHWMLGQAFVRGWEETEFVGKTEDNRTRGVLKTYGFLSKQAWMLRHRDSTGAYYLLHCPEGSRTSNTTS